MKRTLTYACSAVALLLVTIAIAAAQVRAQSSADAEAAAEAAWADAEAADAVAGAQAEAAAAQAQAVAAQAAAAAEQAVAAKVQAADIAVEAAAPVIKKIRTMELHRAWAPTGVSWERSAPDADTIKLIELDRKLSGEVAEIVAKFRNISDDEDRAVAGKALADAVTKQFTVRQQMREKQLEQLEEQVARLRGLQEQRTAQKDRIIADRVQQLIREATGLGWGETSDNFDFKFDVKVNSDALPFGVHSRIAAPARVMTLDAGAAAPVIITAEGDRLIRTDGSDEPFAGKPDSEGAPKK
jgi:hypothetical protein